jgi:uncharacterized protein
MSRPVPDPVPVVARDLSLPAAGVKAVVALLDEGNTVPFIARYRKEATGGIDEVGIRDIQTRLGTLRALEERRTTILATITEQGRLTPELEAQLLGCTAKAELEDLYLPYKPKRKTRGTVALALGLGPLADRILSQPRDGDPDGEARRFVRGEVPDTGAALQGARDIAAERVAEDPRIRRGLRTFWRGEATLRSKKARGAPKEPTPFDRWVDHEESARRVPSHRYLALRRGEREGVLSLKLRANPERVLPWLLDRVGHHPRSPWGDQLQQVTQDAATRLLAPAMETALHQELKERADGEAIAVFAKNLEDLLLASPFGQRSVLAIDPGFRTGCKCTALDGTGRLLAHGTIHPHTGADARSRAARDLEAMIRRHRPDAIAVGNGTAGRETLDFVRTVLEGMGSVDLPAISVSEAGASVYSASDIARAELPDLDVSVRGAVSIGRRLQDPLAELVKIEPRSIGVGQYQHDVSQPRLEASLDAVVETVVNRVGVELNTASPAILEHVAGIGPALAKAIVARREEVGPFRRRKDLLDVPRLGRRAFEQAAGFLRIRDGQDPLDGSAVHPERYRLVAQMARDLGVRPGELVGAPELVDRIDPDRYLSAEVGRPTLEDILAELRKPGRDPREAFETAAFREDVTTVDDLEEGMELEGVVTNVTAFGAFVDVGVHRDGLVHISELADRYVSDPGEVVRVGQPLRVRVLSVDKARNRISLSAKSRG